MFGFKAFRKDNRGATAIVFSLAIIPVLGGFTLAYDYSSVMTARSNYQRITDSAALAGATASNSDSDNLRKQRAKEWFDAQVAANNLTPVSSQFDVTNGAVTVKAGFTQKSLFSISGLGEYNVGVSSTALISQEAIRRVLDVAMCIDATGSMQNTIDSVKSRAQSFSADLNTALKNRGYDAFDYTRIRVVFYRDYFADRGNKPVASPSYSYEYGSWISNAPPMTKSDFFPQPAEKSALETFIGSEKAMGGGDLPESGYECINEAMASKWFKKNDVIPGTEYKADEIYPVVILWSDADAQPVGKANAVAQLAYPAAMPRDNLSFLARWNAEGIIDQKNRLLVHFGLCNNGSWSTARIMTGYMCGGTLSEGNTNMINKIADVMAVRYQNKLTRLTK
ncbi:MAG: pilus assembly protein [Proteobacteria bacterium]|nr:pilus assembly protein [Pseudomonadota bacterium]